MAHFAKLNTYNQVQAVIVVDNSVLLDESGNESEAIGVAFCKSLYGDDTEWKQTSYSGTFRKNYAGIGYTYDEPRNAFIPVRPFISWVLNETTCQWEPPVEYPDDGKQYRWDESTTNWIEV